MLSNGHIVIRFENSNPTTVWSQELTLTDSHTGDYGFLCGVIHDNLRYSKQIGDKYHLDMYQTDNHQFVRHLPVSVTSPYISASTHADSAGFIIIDMQLAPWIYSQLHPPITAR